jgi:damage-control phosphatase, subfamily I
LRTCLDCLPCVMSQLLRASRAAGADEEQQRQVLDEMAAAIPGLSLTMRPPEIAQLGHRIVRRITGNPDPYRAARNEANRAVLSYYPSLKESIADAADPLLAACKLAIAGNAIDLGPRATIPEISSVIAGALTAPLAVDDYAEFKQAVSRAENILYLGDNAGEIVFDRLLIEEIRRHGNPEISFVVRGAPVINDAVEQDAYDCGLNEVANIINNGSDAPATILAQCPLELRRLYDTADLIIAKGQGNYESLDEEPNETFFFLQAKCALVADNLGVKVGDAILERRPR